MVCLKVYERRKRWFWKLLDHKDREVARVRRGGYRTYAGAKDDARYVMEALQNCLR